MAAMDVSVVTDPANDLVLLERVFLRLGSADTDEQLQTCIGKFLTPVLLKLASPHEQVRKKVMELLLHINKRVRPRAEIQLPIDALIQQYQDARATSFVINFTKIYLTMGFPRLTSERKIEVIPLILTAISTRAQAHQDNILLMLMPVLGSLGHKASTLNFKERPEQTKSLLKLMKDILLLPYWAVPGNSSVGSEMQIPPGMSLSSYKRVTDKDIKSADELEKTKQSIVNFLTTDALDDKDILLCLIIAAADSRFSVANIANAGLGKVCSSVDWSTQEICTPLYQLFLGNTLESLPNDQKTTPACTRIRLKLLQYLAKASGDGIVFPYAVNMICSALTSANTNPRLKTLALNFSINIITCKDTKALNKYGPLVLSELVRITEQEEEQAHHSQAFTCIGQVALKVSISLTENFKTIESLFNKMPSAAPELRMSIREALLALANAFKSVEDNVEPMDTSPVKACPNREESNQISSCVLDQSQKDIMIALLEKHMDNDDPMVRFVATRYASVLFTNNHIPSRYLLLLASGDNKDDVKMDALKSLYGTSRSSEIEDIVQNITIIQNQEEQDNKKSQSVINKGVSGPSFQEIVVFIWQKILKRKESSNLKHRFVVSNQVLPFPPVIYFEMLRYLRMCLNRDAGIKNGIPHPSESSPVLSKYLNNVILNTEALECYINMIKLILPSNPEVIPFSCLLDIVGCAPIISPKFIDLLPFLKNQFTNNMREEVREVSAILYAFIKSNTSTRDELENDICQIIDTCKGIKSLESQCGLMAAYANLLERDIMALKKNNSKDNFSILEWKPYVDGVAMLINCLSSNQNLVVNTACKNISLIGKCHSLPLVNKIDEDVDNLKEDVKIEKDTDLKDKSQIVSKLGLVNKLFSIINNTKFTSKTKERATIALGYITIGEKFPFSKNIIKGFLHMAKETKDFEIHLQIGEALVFCVDGVNSPENRDLWSEEIPDSNNIVKDNQSLTENDENLEWLLTELLSFVKVPHPNSRQAACIWLLALLKNCPKRIPIVSKLSIMQDAFMEFLSENSDIVQDVASKGLSLVYQCSNETEKKELVDKLVDQLAGGKRQVTQVTQDTKIFEEGQLGKTPTGSNLSTYKELCSFASDLNQPDLIYKFMHLANHNAIWNSKKGAAFGFHSIAKQAGTQLAEHLPKIVPRLYRYRFDPTPKIQNSMSSIWHALVPETQKTVEKYQSEILNDLITNLTANQWRIRMSCCLAITDILRVTRGLNNDVSRLQELWAQLFRVMDDVHEGTRNAAENTALVLSKYCIRITDVSQGKSGKEVLGVILPVLLSTGITNTVAEVRRVSLQTVSKMVTSAGESLKPFLPQLIPALLQATGDLESTKLSQLSVMLGEKQQSQEIVDSVRAQAAKSHYTTETVTKCIPFIDITTFDAMLPSVLELMKSPQLGTKIACTYLFTCVIHQLGKEIMPVASKIMFSLVNGLLDRNTAVRKHCSDAIGSLVGCAKETSIDKLLAKLCTWYNERDEESVRNSIALTLQAIANKHGELLKEKSNAIMPMLFLAMHAEKTPETKTTVELYEEVWLDISPGKEQGIRMHLLPICSCLKETINSPSWSMKTQTANAIATIALEMKSGLGNQREELVTMLLGALRGRIWQGKEKLLHALANLCRCSADDDKLSNDLLQQVIDSIMRECKKKDLIYKRHSLSALGDILEVLKVDHFEQAYNILHDTLTKDVNSVGKDSDDEDTSPEDILKKKEQYILLKEVAYETMGKAWPDNIETQQKYQRVFASHCSECIATNTRTVQVAILIALKFYVEKLILLKNINLSPDDKNMQTDSNVEKMEVESVNSANLDDLSFITKHIVLVLDYSFGIAKHTRLRKEALNILYSFGKQVKELKNDEFTKLKDLYSKYESDLTNDNAPEIRTRLVNIKVMFQDK